MRLKKAKCFSIILFSNIKIRRIAHLHPSIHIMLPYYFNIVSIIAFAITGALAAIQSKKEMDIIAVIILGVVTAVGGGTARDVILNFEVFWVKDPTMLVAAVAALL